MRIAGRIGARLKGGGTLGKPLLTGTLAGDALGIEAPQWGVALTGGRLRAELEGDRLRIVEATIAGGEGRFNVRGTLPLRVAEGGTALQWQAERFRVLNRPDMRLVVSGSGDATFDGKKFGLKGELRADNGHFEAIGGRLPELDDDIVIAGREPVARDKRGPLPIDLDLRLDLGQQLTLRGFGFTGGVAGSLRVVTNAAGELLAQGRLRAVRARFRAYGQELEVDPGSLIFDGPLARPGLDITAWRRHQAVEAGVRVTGTIEAPRVELISNPPVADADKLSWLVLGRAPSTASGADLAILQAASGALLAGDQEPLQRRIAQRLGLDEITVRSSSDLSSAERVRARQAAVGQALRQLRAGPRRHRRVPGQARLLAHRPGVAARPDRHQQRRRPVLPLGVGLRRALQTYRYSSAHLMISVLVGRSRQCRASS